MPAPVALADLPVTFAKLKQDFKPLYTKTSKAAVPPFVVELVGGDPTSKDVRGREIVVRPNPEATSDAIQRAIHSNYQVYTQQFRCLGLQGFCKCGETGHPSPMIVT